MVRCASDGLEPIRSYDFALGELPEIKGLVRIHLASSSAVVNRKSWSIVKNPVRGKQFPSNSTSIKKFSLND
jgi:hypothetical protein